MLKEKKKDCFYLQKEKKRYKKSNVIYIETGTESLYSWKEKKILTL